MFVVDFCQNYTVKTSYHPHPTNCHNFVQCENGVPYARVCPENLCYGVAETNSCDHCYIVTCLTGRSILFYDRDVQKITLLDITNLSAS